MKKSKIVTLLATAAIAILLISTASFGSVMTMEDGRVFDPQYYAENNPDVKAAFGDDIGDLYAHYLAFGINEGRKPFADSLAGPGMPVGTGNLQNQDFNVKIAELRKAYPDGMKWDESNTYQSDRKGRGNRGVVKACQAFAYMLQDILFPTGNITISRTPLKDWVERNREYYMEDGVKKSRTWVRLSYEDNIWYPLTAYDHIPYDGSDEATNAAFEKLYPTIKPGDILIDAKHANVVLSKSDRGVTVVSGNVGGKVCWDETITRDALRKGLFQVEAAP